MKIPLTIKHITFPLLVGALVTSSLMLAHQAIYGPPAPQRVQVVDVPSPTAAASTPVPHIPPAVAVSPHALHPALIAPVKVQPQDVTPTPTPTDSPTPVETPSSPAPVQSSPDPSPWTCNGDHSLCSAPATTGSDGVLRPPPPPAGNYPTPVKYCDQTPKPIGCN